MDAVDLLTRQHRMLETTIKALKASTDAAERAALLAKAGDDLTVHLASEEEIFYPAVRERRTEDILLESLEEHLSLKRLLATDEPLSRRRPSTPSPVLSTGPTPSQGRRAPPPNVIRFARLRTRAALGAKFNSAAAPAAPGLSREAVATRPRGRAVYVGGTFRHTSEPASQHSGD